MLFQPHVSTQAASTFEPKETIKYFNRPTVSSVTDTTAQVSLSGAVLGGISEDEKAGIYFEYMKKDLVCIAIYPTPTACLPQKPNLERPMSMKNLKPNTTYTVLYKRDNTIRCITTPCPGNEFESLFRWEFTTKQKSGAGTLITKICSLEHEDTSNGPSNILIERGFMRGTATGILVP